MLRELNLEEQGVKSRGDWVRYLGVPHAAMACYFIQYVH